MKKGKISKHFKRHEFSCPCGCGQDTVDAELIHVLEGLRDRFKSYYGKVRVIVTSGNRCKAHNDSIHGAPKSTHLKSIAADFYVEHWGLGSWNPQKELYSRKWKRISSSEIADHLECKYPNRYGVGRYHNRTHLDVRAEKARWSE